MKQFEIKKGRLLQTASAQAAARQNRRTCTREEKNN